MTFTDNKGNIINVGDSIEWVITVFKSKFDKNVSIDNPLIMKEVLTLEILNNEQFNNAPIFRSNHTNYGWYWSALHDINAECFNVSVLKIEKKDELKSNVKYA